MNPACDRRLRLPGRLASLAAPAFSCALLLAAPAARAADPWAQGSQWASIKLGYAKAAVRDAAEGNLGGGVAYSYFLRKQWAVGLALHYEVLGRYQGPAEIEMPLTFETAYHFRWPTQALPYVGAGTGAFFHSYKFTGDDTNDTRWGSYVLGGMDLPISDHSLVGSDARLVFETKAKSANPWFPVQDNTVMHWSLKVSYTYVF